MDEIEWIDLDTMIACRACLNFSTHSEVPHKLKATGNFGMIKKNQEKKALNQQKKRHSEKPLHTWCVKKEQDEAKCKSENQDKNYRAGEKVVRNAHKKFRTSSQRLHGLAKRPQNINWVIDGRHQQCRWRRS